MARGARGSGEVLRRRIGGVSAAHSPALRRLGGANNGNTLARPPGPLDDGARKINLSHGMRRVRSDEYRRKNPGKGVVFDGRRVNLLQPYQLTL
jgi:hypothetical protein